MSSDLLQHGRDVCYLLYQDCTKPRCSCAFYFIIFVM